MAKRVPPEEKEYRPVREDVVRDVMSRKGRSESGTVEGSNSGMSAVVPDGNAAAVAVVDEPSPAPSAPDMAPDVPAEDEAPKMSPRREVASDEQDNDADKADGRSEDASAEEDSDEKREKQSDEDKKPQVRKTFVREKRMLLTLEEERALESLVSDMRRGLGVQVKISNVLRACVTLLLNVQDELSKQCHRTKFTKLPRYGDPTSIVNFEENIARLLDTAVRNTKSLDR